MREEGKVRVDRKRQLQHSPSLISLNRSEVKEKRGVERGKNWKAAKESRETKEDWKKKKKIQEKGVGNFRLGTANYS